LGKRGFSSLSANGALQLQPRATPWETRLDPFRGSFFDFLHGLADRHGATEFKEDVNMIGDRVYEDRRAAKVLENGCHVTMQGIAHGVVEDWLAVPCAENEVNVQPREGLWHGLARSFRACRLLVAWSQGVALGYN